MRKRCGRRKACKLAFGEKEIALTTPIALGELAVVALRYSTKLLLFPDPSSSQQGLPP